MDACRYVIARFVPDPIRDEPINIGVILQCSSRKYASCRFLDDYRRIARLGPNIDVSLLHDFSDDFKLRIDSFSKPYEQPFIPEPQEHQSVIEDAFLNELVNEYGNRFQFTAPRPVLSDNLTAELTHLFDLFVADKRNLPRSPQRVTHSRIREHLYTMFNKYELIGKEKIQYQFSCRGMVKEDGYTFDFGRENGNISIYQSVALDASQEDEKIDRAYILKGRVEDVRTLALKNRKKVDAYAITYSLPENSQDYAGTTEAKKIINETDIQIIRFDDEYLSRFLSRLRTEVLPASI